MMGLNALIDTDVDVQLRHWCGSTRQVLRLRIVVVHQAIPVLSILKEILKEGSAEVGGKVQGALKPPASIKKAILVWVSRHGSEFSLLDDEIIQMMRSVKLYSSREMRADF